MTSGNFESVIIDSIYVDREGRQRRELRNIDELAESIRNTGLIHPPVITRDLQLVAGERRLTACKQLGWTSIPVQYADELDELALHLIELEENVKREALDWRDQTLAIEQYHALRGKQEKGWTAGKTAAALGIAESTVSQHVAVAKQMNDAHVNLAPKFSTALGIVARKQERSKGAAKKELISDISSVFRTSDEPEPPPAPIRAAQLLHADFSRWAPKYVGEPFNFLHCDFPYGINADKHAQGSAALMGGYEDGEDVYFNLINCLGENLDRICAPSAHLMFWLSMNFYTETVAALSAMGWKVGRTPLIWHRSDNKGILPDPNRGPRQVYEVCLFASRGDRKVVRAVSNLVAAATTKDYHMSEKPSAVLNHFFRMLVDESTRLLDPTCGSGMAVKVAEELGAEAALGLERDEDFFGRAKDNVGL